MVLRQHLPTSKRGRDTNGGRAYPAQDSIASANAAVARDIVSRADW